NLHILILAFNLIARPVAVIIRFIFLRMMFGRYCRSQESKKSLVLRLGYATVVLAIYVDF
ncbi:hypothetical protein COY03_02320, partial [bacterium CG_4_10_14_0_2_um_filter_48_144]